MTEISVPGKQRQRCSWARDPLEIAYHDDEWGVLCHDDRELFERLMLEGFQAGLSWLTILRKRENFLRAFDGWNPDIIARYDEADVTRLLGDPGIIRNRLKIRGAITNAKAYLKIREEIGSFNDFVWQFAPSSTSGRTTAIQMDEIPAETEESRAMSKALRKRGFTFVGPTICYAFMQSVGIVDDHIEGCFRAAS